MNPAISIIIPAYNEEARIGATLESLERYARHRPLPPEVIVVDDGSRDSTAEVVRRYQRERSMGFVKLLPLGANHGKGYAVRAGMQVAAGRWRLFMDADNSVDISHLDTFLAYARRGFDMVVGSIEVAGAVGAEHNGIHRRILSWLGKVPVKLFITSAISDTQRGFKLFSEQAADLVFRLQTIDRWGFDIELVAIALCRRLRIKEAPVVWNNPAGSKVNLKSYLATFVELARIIRNKFAGLYAAPQEDVRQFTPEEESAKGKGFVYRGQEFIHHAALDHRETAFWTLARRQKALLLGLVIALAAFLVVDWYAFLLFVFCSLTILYFLDLIFNGIVIYRAHRYRPEISVSAAQLAAIDERSLPLYTIFCPLYREWQVAPQFVRAMSALDYPAEKLQILLLLEENDYETIRKINESALPANFEVVIVPHSIPKTKPKAMNYGMRHVRGDYLVIYDAEDMPEPDQLKKAFLAFGRSPAGTVCVQAKLNFYSAYQNTLTRLFTAEYSLWFDLILPGLQSLGVPLPLGGTSNHFRVSALRAISGWDAFNVTEDCDLGVRLSKCGWRVAIVESTTYEEANSRALNWYNQRSRWVKGYIQTYLVHTRNSAAFVEACGWKDFLAFQLIVGGKVLSMFINPLMWIITISYFLFRAHIGLFIQSLFPGPIFYIGAFSLIFGNFMYIYYYMIACSKRGYDGIIKYVFLVPFYWLGMSAAAWKGLYEIAVKPHYWSKTVHGLHLQKPPAPAGALVSAPDAA